MAPPYRRIVGAAQCPTERLLNDAKPLRSVGRVPLFLLLKRASDRLALEALFKSTGGAGWHRKGGLASQG